MTAVILPEASWELDSIPFGPGSDIAIQTVDFGDVELVLGDVPRPRADGIMFGQDRRGGRVLTFELTVLTDYGLPEVPGYGGYGTVASLDTLRQLSMAWSADQVRTTPGAVSRLRYRLGGRQRTFYGRGRKFAVVSGYETLGRIPVTATFQAVDQLTYDDVEQTTVVPFVPPPAGGLTWPVTFPWTTIPVAYSPGEIAVAGDAPSWLTIVINGPISNPSVRLVGGWTVGLDLVVQPGEYVVIDPRPWSRGVRVNGVTNVAGALTSTSPRLSELRLPFGVHELVLTGADSTGSSSMVLVWRNAYSSF